MGKRKLACGSAARGVQVSFWGEGQGEPGYHFPKSQLHFLREGLGTECSEQSGLMVESEEKQGPRMAGPGCSWRSLGEKGPGPRRLAVCARSTRRQLWPKLACMLQLRKTRSTKVRSQADTHSGKACGRESNFWWMCMCMTSLGPTSPRGASLLHSQVNKVDQNREQAAKLRQEETARGQAQLSAKATLLEPAAEAHVPCPLLTTRRRKDLGSC